MTRRFYLPKTNLRQLLIVTAFVAVFCAWYIDRSRLDRELRELKQWSELQKAIEAVVSDEWDTESAPLTQYPSNICVYRQIVGDGDEASSPQLPEANPFDETLSEDPFQ